ncbi:MAG: aminopeptidase [Treponema sp.]|uniref:aminopeptidase n=1 Tax=Treponema sp. TaxID=166 RepID=UPI0025E077F0|nr:aminopeptidase [Treponema sp.]MBQ9282529.1 aminopeptidase [Treponema sp.]
MKNESLINDYKSFLDSGKTERECVDALISLAEKAGFRDVFKTEFLKAGDKVYVQKMNKAIALFVLGTESIEKGMNILGAHIDSPRLDVKQNPLYEKDFLVYLNTHYYGGIKKYQWVTLPLAIHGVVCKKDGTCVKVCVGESESDPVFCISDILPHLAQKQMKETASDFIPGESLDLILGSAVPSKDEDEKSEEKKDKITAKKAILSILKDKYEIEEDDFGSAELEIVPAGKARDLGFDRSLILGYGQDDRSCAYTSARALLESTPGARTNCCLCVDKEEIGSVGATGMGSHFFENALAEVIARLPQGYSELSLRRCLANCNMLSSDVNAAFDPMNCDLFDRANASFLNGGIVFNKYTGSRGKSGASDANPEFIARLRSLFDKAGVTYQMAELGKVDQGGGGTIAYLAAKYGMNVLDAGVSVLSMHAPWEITAKEDIEQAFNAYKAFLTLE